ncbi:centrosomal protein of 295 kDa isoform X18 [Mus musculus]|uniref:centrosomal protein of 295 kDa isoform X18 n=1 Tax=Mus musculus TaxID=10090 RepID=UPI0007EE02C3|nr:centrosomal protein of 295 kDa isoform X18 [Mus musculus]|eukprot:XP_017168913.1 PREDICTED: centrosomal protein of 295 kDa isoform X12 [Mus musculus]
MTEVTRAGSWLSRRYPNGCWVAGRVRVPVCREARPHTLSDPLYLTYSEMKRKGMNTKLRLSPSEEAFILKEDYERRRKLRLLQVREQERGIAFQIREGIKQRRSQQVSHLAEELRAKWEEAQSQKIQNLEKLYLASLRHMGDGHRQAKENEPDLDALSRRAAERKRKAEVRHKEALKVQKNQKEMLMKQKTRHIKARKEAVLVEKQRSAKMARLPPPVPSPFENIDVNRIPSLKTNSSTYHHISTFVSRQMGTKQPDAHLAAEEEARRVERLRKQAAQERVKQFERAHVRGSQAMKKIHLAQNQERLMEELKQLQKEDLARRRQTVAQMPPQMLELPYRRSEMKEDRQRELEFAFEDMYNADRKVKGNLILHLKPEPLPTISDQLQDEELDLSMEQENQVPLAAKIQQIPSRILFKRLLNKIRSQKSLWTIKSVSEDEGEVTSSIIEIESKVPSVDSGAIITEERTAASFEQEQVTDSDRLTIESGPLSSEDKPLYYKAGTGREQAMAVSPPATAVAQSSVLLHPQEEAVRIRMSLRRKQIMEIEEQKQKQLELLEQIEQQKLRLETDCFRAQLEEQRKQADQPEVCCAPMSHAMISDEDSHRQMIRNYQHQLLQQNRLHKETVETARKRLLEYQTVLKERSPSLSASALVPDSVVSGPPQQSYKPAAASDSWDPSQRLKLSPSKYQPVQPSQIPALEQSHIQVPRHGHITQRQGKMAVSEMLGKQPVESQERQWQFSQVETHQGDYEFVLKDSHSLSRTLSYVRPQTLQDAREVSKPPRVIICQSLDSQQISSEDSENISSKPSEPSPFLPLVPERPFTSLPVKFHSGTIHKPFTTINQSVISQMHDQPLSSSETITAQQGDLRFLQEQLELQKKVLQARQEAREKLLLCTQKELGQQTGLPVFLPSPAGNIFSSLPSASAESGNFQTSSTKSDATVSSDNMDRLWDSSQPISSQQTHLEFLQEQSSVETDNLQARREAQEVLFAHTQNTLEKIVRSEQAGSSLPHQVAQQSFSSLTLADTQSKKIQKQPLPANKKGLLPSQSEVSKAQDGSSGFLQQTLPLQNTLKLLQEQLTRQRSMIPPRRDGQETLLLYKESCSEDSEAGPVESLSSVVVQHADASRAVSEVPKRLQDVYSSEEENRVLSSHLITHGFPQHSLQRQEHFTPLQEETHIQRLILGARKNNEEFAPKQNELEKGLCSQQTDALSSPSQVTDWGTSRGSVSVRSDRTDPLRHFKIPAFRERLVRVSQHTFPLQDNLQEHQEWVDTEKESFQSSPLTPENPSSQQTGFSSFKASLRLPSCVSLPSADSGITQHPLSTESDSKVKSSHLQIPELQHRLSKISQLIPPQQDSLKALQEQLATQREAIIHSRQEAHEETLREWKEKIFPEQARNPTDENDLEMQKREQLGGWFPHTQGLTWGDAGQGSANGEQPRADVHAEHNGKAEFYQDRDPLRVSVSREQSFLESPLAHDPFGCHQPPAQENSKSHDDNAEAVKVKKSDVEDHAVLSHAVSKEEACTNLGPLGKPDDEAETQEISQEPLSSVTVSTGSFLSYEITDLSLTDPESFSEQTEHLEQESTNKQEETDPLSIAVPSVIYQQQHSLGAHNSLLPMEEESTSDHTHVQQIMDNDVNEANLIPDKRDFQVPAVDLDFRELEHIFPHLHRQLFKPLEPHLDFDLSSPGTSQEDSDFYQSSESSSEKHVKALSTGTICFPALTAKSHSPNPRLNQLDINLAHATTEGSEQSFQQLRPEFSSQESQHADLPSIYSIEARGPSQRMENQNYSEMLQNKKKSLSLQPSTEDLTPACSSSDTALFDQLHLQHSTPCASVSSECSVKLLESREEVLGFEELSRRAVTMSQRLTEDENVVLPINPHVGRVEKEASVQGSNPLSIQNEKPIQNFIETDTTEAVGNVCQLAQAEHILKSCPFRSPIPIWVS